MAKKTTKRTSRSGSHYSAARFFAMLGGVLTIIFHVIALVEGVPGGDINRIIYGLVGVLMGILVLGSTNLVTNRFLIPLEWWSLLVLGIIDAIVGGNIGTIFIIIAAIILLIRAL
jgi:hypothetical protein